MRIEEPGNKIMRIEERSSGSKNQKCEYKEQTRNRESDEDRRKTMRIGKNQKNVSHVKYDPNYSGEANCPVPSTHLSRIITHFACTFKSTSYAQLSACGVNYLLSIDFSIEIIFYYRWLHSQDFWSPWICQSVDTIAAFLFLFFCGNRTFLSL